MSEVKWIKITTDMFEDEKIDFIQSLPEADAILVIWIRLLGLAGKCNAGGYIYLTENIPYEPQMLSHKFRKPITIINLAIETFQRLGMLQRIGNNLYITNWCKHQNIDGLDKIREQARIRMKKYREKSKLLDGNVTRDVTVTQSNAIDIDKELDKEVDKEEHINEFALVISCLNDKLDTKYKPSSKKTRQMLNARFEEGYTLEDFKTVIDKKVAEWKDTEMEKFLRPETLFGTKFEGYLNQCTLKKENPEIAEARKAVRRFD